MKTNNNFLKVLSCFFIISSVFSSCNNIKSEPLNSETVKTQKNIVSETVLASTNVKSEEIKSNNTNPTLKPFFNEMDFVTYKEKVTEQIKKIYKVGNEEDFYKEFNKLNIFFMGEAFPPEISLGFETFRNSICNDIYSTPKEYAEFKIKRFTLGENLVTGENCIYYNYELVYNDKTKEFRRIFILDEKNMIVKTIKYDLAEENSFD